MTIDLDDVEKDYGDLVALHPLSAGIGTGQAVALVGHNGSGKSTLLKMIAGLLEPSGGTISIDDHPAGTPDARAAVSYVPDEPVLYDDLSVREHLLYVAALHGHEATDEMVDDLVGKLGLTTTLLAKLSVGFGFSMKYDQNPAALPLPSGTPAGQVYAASFQPFADKLDTLTELNLIYTFL